MGDLSYRAGIPVYVEGAGGDVLGGEGDFTGDVAVFDEAIGQLLLKCDDLGSVQASEASIVVQYVCLCLIFEIAGNRCFAHVLPLDAFDFKALLGVPNFCW